MHRSDAGPQAEHRSVPLAARALAGMVPGDHVCCSFGSDDEHQAIVGRFTRQALARRERVLYLTDRTDEATIRDYLDEAGVDSAAGLARGGIEIRPFDQAQGGGALDPEAMIAGLDAEGRRALRDGYSALAVTGEMSWAIGRPAEQAAVIAYEREATRVFSTARVESLCQCDRRLFPDELLSRLAGVHDFTVVTTDHSSVATRGRATVSEREELMGVVLAGEIDMQSAPYLTERLAERRSGDLVVETRELRFIDVAGCRALVRAAERLENGRRLVLPDAAAPLVRVLSMCGWAEHPRLVLSAADQETA
jgi:anti-anti-sigma factor